MPITPGLIPDFIKAVADSIEKNSTEVTALDQAIGDGDHVFNLQRGLKALQEQAAELAKLDWVSVWQKIGMILMTTIGGASGSLYGTLFIAMSQAGRDKSMNLKCFADVFAQGVEAVKLRGKADAGEKTLLDVYIPVAEYLKTVANSADMSEVLQNISRIAVEGMESTQGMVATKGRASFLGERSKGHIDAGAKTAQLMICALVDVLNGHTSNPSATPS